ncbi:MAG: NADH-quinone oxidoreductase subunit J [Elusimicrobia bacterium CG11_big_fil_rev_8_21_14_0_20_64_6]|nr:MAG: NADH-quinone oxidoreductase subunit J [Elusimicrobia bacterium CG11_big_fil_rev_8_21_14_0_20_64_6]
MLDQIVFYSLAILTLSSALAVVLHRNTVHSSLFLGLSLAAVAGLYASLGADFLFGAQIMVYVSGIAVLVMFVVMLLGRASDLHLRQVNERWMAALLVCAVASVGLFKVARLHSATIATGVASPSTHNIGRLFLSDWILPFELISLVLLAALLGAVFFTRTENAR